MIVQVTTEDIRDGVRGDKCACPVARALIRALGDTSVEVGYLCCTTNNKMYLWPDEISNFIHAFDRGDVVKPFSFDLETLSVVEDKP